MAVAADRVRPKTAADLLGWLEREVSPHLEVATRAIAHGGTALALLGIKDSTKDVDFAFQSQDEFDRFTHVLESLGFTRRRDIRANPKEVYQRFENPSSIVDVVDVRFPTWNNWRVSKAVLGKALIMRLGNLRLVRLDRDAIFLYKTYPLRETDVDDLRTILTRDPPNESRVTELFTEQDGIHRSELSDDTAHEPLFNILELRVRFAASLELIGPLPRRSIPRIARLAKRQFDDLRLRQSFRDLIDILRHSDLVSWDSILGEDFGPLRSRLAKVPPGRRKPSRHR